MIRDVMEKISQSVSGGRIFNSVREISNYHRIQASPGYRAAAQHVQQRLAQSGFNAVIHTYPADGSTWFFTSKMFRE